MVNSASKNPVDELIDKFLNYLLVEKGLSPNTIESYSRDLQKFVLYLEKNNISDLNQVTALEVIDFLLALKSKGLASKTTGRNLSALRTFFKFLLQGNYLSVDPTLNIDSPKIQLRLPSILSIAEVESLLCQPDGAARRRSGRDLIKRQNRSGCSVTLVEKGVSFTLRITPMIYNELCGNRCISGTC